MKKTIFCISMSLWIQISLIGQCVVDAGESRNICPEDQLTEQKLYGEILSGDVVQTQWTSEFYQSFIDQYYFASTMLNDTTLLEPIIEQHFERTVKFYLTGITSKNDICTDSVEINFSDWLFLAVDKMWFKHPNDTTQLWISAGSSWPHIKYEWSPNYMISDTTIENPYVWNDTTTFYRLLITDSIGCSVNDDIFEVYTKTASTNNVIEDNIEVYPNPTSKSVIVTSNEEINKLKLFALNGQMIKEQNDNVLNLSAFDNGLYILRIEFKNKKFTTRMIQKVNE